jgi:uncharacterized repeat protein (TIGR01451 family)
MGDFTRVPRRRIRARFSTLFWVIGLAMLLPPANAVFGASRLVFPRFSFDGGTLTGVAIVNPTGENASVTLTAYGPDGARIQAPGFRNPSVWQIDAGRQKAQLLHEWFGASLSADRMGWFEVVSGTSGLTGFFLFLNLEGTQFDGADLPETAEQIVFNQVRAGDGYATELNLINPGDVQAEVSLKLTSSEMADISRTLSIPSRGMRRLDAAQLFGVSRIPVHSHVRAASSAPIAGFEFVRSEKGDLIGMNARRERERLTELYFPQLAVKGPWKTELGIVNYSTSPAILTVSAYRADGKLFGAGEVTANPVTLTLNRNGTLLVDVAEVFGFQGSQTRDGWIKVVSSSASVNGYITYGVPGSGSVALVSTAAEGRRRALFSHIATVPGFFTGLAILNPGSLVANIRVMAFTKEGAPLGTYDTALPPGHRISKVIQELVGAAADNQGGGFIWLKSDIPVYSTSLFGTAKVLANIPPQEAPEAFAPDAGTATLRITPPLAAVQPGKPQKFQVTGAAGTVTWKVNGIAGGNDQVGRVTADGFYTAPPNLAAQVVSITAETPGRSAGASIDVLRSSDFFSGLGLIQAVTYLQGLKRLYQAELLGSGAGGSEDDVSPASGSGSSEIYELVPPATRIRLAGFQNEEIADMEPYEASNGKEYLLLAARTTGRILRLDPAAPQSAAEVVATGLTQPGAMVVDRVSGNLLVAERDKITTVSRASLEAGLKSKPAGVLSPAERSPDHRPGLLLGAGGATGIVVDECGGDVYFSNAATGTIGVYSRATGESSVVADQLFGPAEMLAIYRRGVSCPSSLNLLVIEREVGWVSLVLPLTGEIYVWFEVPAAFDVTFLPEGNPFTEVAGVLLGQFFDESGDLFFIELPGDYAPEPTNALTSQCQGSVFLGDPFLEAIIRQALGLGADELLTCEVAEGLYELWAESAYVDNLYGLEFFPYLQIADLYDNLVFDIEPLSKLPLLQALELGDNLIFDLDGLENLFFLWYLGLSDNFITDVSPLTYLWNLEYLDLYDNLISDIEPLVYNFGLDDESFVDLRRNLLGLDDCRNLQQLRIQGAEVLSDVDCSVLPRADVVVSVAPSAAAVGDGAELGYRITITNEGPQTATQVLLLNFLPAEAFFDDVQVSGPGACVLVEEILLVCLFTEVPRLGQVRVDVGTTVYPFGGDFLVNEVLVSADQYDPYIWDNRAKTYTPVVP